MLDSTVQQQHRGEGGGGGEVCSPRSSFPCLINEQSVKKLYWSLAAFSAHFFAPSSVSLNQVMRPPCSIRRLFHSASFLSVSLCKALPSCDALSFFLLPSLLLCFITSIFPFLFGCSPSPSLPLSSVPMSLWKLGLGGDERAKRLKIWCMCREYKRQDCLFLLPLFTAQSVTAPVIKCPRSYITFKNHNHRDCIFLHTQQRERGNRWARVCACN